MTELETMQRAKMYLDKLARGIDPITGRQITGNIVAGMGDPNMKRPNAKAITAWLMQRSLMELTIDPEGKQRRLPMEQGLRSGLSKLKIPAFFTGKNAGFYI